MRVLLIATNRYDRCMSRMNAQPLPIGLAYLAGALAASPHIVKTLDLMFSDDPLGDVQQVVQEFQPALVGISIRNLSNQSYLDPQWALPFSKAVIDQVRASPTPPLCVGDRLSASCRRRFSPIWNPTWDWPGMPLKPSSSWLTAWRRACPAITFPV